MAKPLWLHIKEIESELQNARYLWLGLDFDGTLTHFTQTPDGAMLGTEARSTLAALCRQEHMDVAVISGRELLDIRSRVNLEGMAFAGNHGMQLMGNGIEFEDAVANALRPGLKDLETCLHTKSESIPGVWVENKGLSLSVHYRLANPNDFARIESLVRDVTATDPKVWVRAGARTLEILPVSDANKGSAVRMLLASCSRRQPLPIYIGDDATDEDAFKAIPNGITIKVGENCETSARYHVASPSVVYEFLEWLLRYTTKR